MIYKNTPSERVQKKREVKKQRILDSAMVLLAEGGLENVTVHAIADAMDLTVGALYRYFPSKSAILGSLTERTLLDFFEALKAETETHSNQRSRILAFAKTHVAFSRAHPGHFLLISQMMSSPKIVLPPPERSTAMQPAFELIAFLEHHFQRAQEDGSLRLRDPRAHALMYWSAIQGVMQLGKLGRLDPEEMYRDNLPIQIAEDLLKAWSPNVD